MIYDQKPAPKLKMKIHVETALRNVFEGTKLVFGILFPREFNVTQIRPSKALWI